MGKGLMVSRLAWAEEIVSSTLTTRTILYAPMAESIRTGLKNQRPYRD